MCPSPAWAELRAGGTFWQVSGGVIGKSFLWLHLLGLKRPSFYSLLLFLPDASKLLQTLIKCCFLKRKGCFGNSVPEVSSGSLRFGLGEDSVHAMEWGWTNMVGISLGSSASWGRGQEQEVPCIPSSERGALPTCNALCREKVWSCSFPGPESLPLDSPQHLEGVTSRGFVKSCGIIVRCLHMPITVRDP